MFGNGFGPLPAGFNQLTWKHIICNHVTDRSHFIYSAGWATPAITQHGEECSPLFTPQHSSHSILFSTVSKPKQPAWLRAHGQPVIKFWPWNWHVKVNPVFISERWSALLDLAQEIHKMILSFKPISGIKDLDYHPLPLLSFSAFVSFSWSVAVCPSAGPCALVGSVDWYAAGIFGSRWFHAPPRFPRALGALCYLCGARSVW